MDDYNGKKDIIALTPGTIYAMDEERTATIYESTKGKSKEMI